MSRCTIPGSKSEQLHNCTSEPSGFITYNCGYSPPRSLKNTILPRTETRLVLLGAGVGAGGAPVVVPSTGVTSGGSGLPPLSVGWLASPVVFPALPDVLPVLEPGGKGVGMMMLGIGTAVGASPLVWVMTSTTTTVGATSVAGVVALLLAGGVPLGAGVPCPRCPGRGVKFPEGERSARGAPVAWATSVGASDEVPGLAANSQAASARTSAKRAIITLRRIRKPFKADAETASLRRGRNYGR